ncbi:hypothetical protein KP509_20G052700 [Ceratopteris richardii]|uniref:Uncharacterized protein n=1 Tax=Ceratopteris richardii TaxID=49495 RepID=A0A8T2SG34_CERRI|nr:hypothetical protein KP509_20G052700 [Ceratopteris richardii]
MKVQQIVRLRQTLRRWRKRAHKAAEQRAAEVPAGHVAVYVGEERVRFVVRTEHLHHEIFAALLGRCQQEFGFKQAGPLCIPCEAVFFEHLLSLLESSPPAAVSAPPDDHLQELLDFYYSSYPSSPPPNLTPRLAQPASA